MINVTKSYLPPLSDFSKLIESIWENYHLTNRGPLVQRLESEICEKLNIKNLLFVSNGTIALQLAIKALDLKDEVITTPFSYVATTNSLLWEGCSPVFCDINEDTLCIDPSKIESLITPKTTAILATHVYGIPCDVDAIEKIALRHNLKVIYDAAHAFGVEVNSKSIFNFGDISTCSFHATKLFHTIEGGSITAKDPDILKLMSLYHSFGHIGDDYYTQGINGKNCEFHAAMGICNLPKLDELIVARKKHSENYSSLLSKTLISRPTIPENTLYNYAYFPVIFENETNLIQVKELLYKNGINTRRYFFPSLNNLTFLPKYFQCPVSEDISSRVLCLPLYYDLETENIEKICSLINSF
jgi:dTDP-4-amino-4,6-dideoxygalactose transaminase